MVSKKDLQLNRKRNLELVDTDKYRPKINCLEIDINNSFKHELGKFLMFWLIRKGVNADCASIYFNHKPILDAIGYLKENITLFIKTDGVKLKKHEVPHIVSEARMREGHRADLYVLDNNQRIEVVNHCDRSVVKYNDKTIVVRV